MAKNIYFPCLTMRESEHRALAALAEPTKDRLFPLLRIQAWPRKKKDCGGPVQRSIDHFQKAYANRSYGVDLALPREDLDNDWAALGRSELISLRNATGGFSHWCDLVEANSNFVPTLQWSDNIPDLRFQVERLIGLGRGLILRFRRSQGWNIAQLAHLHGINLNHAHILLVFDCEQINKGDDLTVLGLGAQSAILGARGLLGNADLAFVLVGSSFPASFTDNPEYANINIRERQLFDMLRLSPPIVAGKIDLKYGDHASVYASDREPAFRGVPRIDYPTPSRWVYHRCRTGFADAVQKVRLDPDWNETLLCWGAQRIRTAASGDLAGLGSQPPWVAVRLNIHMHLQAHYDEGGAISVDEEWVD